MRLTLVIRSLGVIQLHLGILAVRWNRIEGSLRPFGVIAEHVGDIISHFGSFPCFSLHNAYVLKSGETILCFNLHGTSGLKHGIPRFSVEGESANFPCFSISMF